MFAHVCLHLLCVSFFKPSKKNIKERLLNEAADGMSCSELGCTWSISKCIMKRIIVHQPRQPREDAKSHGPSPPPFLWRQCPPEPVLDLGFAAKDSSQQTISDAATDAGAPLLRLSQVSKCFWLPVASSLQQRFYGLPGQFFSPGSGANRMGKQACVSRLQVVVTGHLKVSGAR